MKKRCHAYLKDRVKFSCIREHGHGGAHIGFLPFRGTGKKAKAVWKEYRLIFKGA